jgi:hypothetical protein
MNDQPGLRNLRFAIIGAGMSGIASAIKLIESGQTDFTVYEKADRVGGTWRENTYPGVTCDVPSHLYRYAFSPNPNWSHMFSPGDEIERYFESVANDYDVNPYIRFNDEVTSCVFKNAKWHIATRSGLSDEVDVVIAATGVLHHPNYPEIDGLHSIWIGHPPHLVSHGSHILSQALIYLVAHLLRGHLEHASHDTRVEVEHEAADHHFGVSNAGGPGSSYLLPSNMDVVQGATVGFDSQRSVGLNQGLNVKLEASFEGGRQVVPVEPPLGEQLVAIQVDRAPAHLTPVHRKPLISAVTEIDLSFQILVEADADVGIDAGDENEGVGVLGSHGVGHGMVDGLRLQRRYKPQV